MSKVSDNRGQSIENAKKKFQEDLKRMGERDLPPAVSAFLKMIEDVKKDEEALRTLREEILKNNGK